MPNYIKPYNHKDVLRKKKPSVCGSRWTTRVWEHVHACFLVQNLLGVRAAFIYIYIDKYIYIYIYISLSLSRQFVLSVGGVQNFLGGSVADIITIRF